MAKYCKNIKKPQLCDSCGEEGHSGRDCNNIKCINCVRDKQKDICHRASDSKCPTFIFQKEVKRAMAIMGINPREASVLVAKNGPLPTQGGRGWNLTSENPFPTLSEFINQIGKPFRVAVGEDRRFHPHSPSPPLRW